VRKESTITDDKVIIRESDKQIPQYGLRLHQKNVNPFTLFIYSSIILSLSKKKEKRKNNILFGEK